MQRIASARKNTLNLAGPEQEFAFTQSGYAQHRFTGADARVRTKAQATLGVAACTIPVLFKQLMALADSSSERGDKVATAAKGLANKEATSGIQEALVGGHTVISKSSARSGATPDDDSAREAEGFVMIILKTIAMPESSRCERGSEVRVPDDATHGLRVHACESGGHNAGTARQSVGETGTSARRSPP